jgi:2-methylcitrate dehydratase PrpD
LFEGDHDVGAVAKTLGKTWRITEVAHKPFPSGRATHGLVDGVLQLKKKHGFHERDVARVESHVPSLTHRLIGRPSKAGMTPGYARLSGQYVVASAILGDGVGVEDFKPDALMDARRLALAAMVHININDNPDPNALAPLRVAIILQNGQRLEIDLDKVYGAPANPMTHEAHLAKFRKNFASASPVVPAAQGEALIAAIDDIENVKDVRTLIDLCMANGGKA